jgi:quinol monooxygenase YgiN
MTRENFDGGRPLREFVNELRAEMRAEQGFIRYWWHRLRAIVMVRWRLRLHCWLHPEALRHVSQEALDAVSNDPNTPAIAAALRARNEQVTK